MLYSAPNIAPATASTIVTARPMAQVPKPWRAPSKRDMRPLT